MTTHTMTTHTIPTSKATQSQVKYLYYSNIAPHKHAPLGTLANIDIVVKLRYDDGYNNGHNTFSITGDDYENGKAHTQRNVLVSGAIADIIELQIPELAHLAKWHLTSTDGPMHYIENTTYHATDRTHAGRPIGEAVAHEERLGFVGMPLTFSTKYLPLDYLLGLTDNDRTNIEPVPIGHETEPNVFKAHYTLSGLNEDAEWCATPFNSLRQAEEFTQLLATFKPVAVTVATKWCELVQTNLEDARRCAVAPDATLEQLQDVEWLADRLPQLMHDFKNDIEALGFTY